MARGTVAVKFVGDISGLQRSIGDADNSLGSFGSKVNSGIGTFAKWGAAAAVAGGVAVGAFGVKAVRAASDLNEQISKVGVVFGDQAKIVTGFANQMARDFGLPKTQILEAASGIGLVGKASGLAQADAAKLGSKMAGLAADASSFYNVPLDEALAAIQSGLVGEAEPLRKYGVLLSEAAVQEEAVRLGIAKVGDKLTEQQKVQARSSLITKGMSDASGDLARTQDGLANRMRELKGRAENFAATVGTALLPMVLTAFDLFEKLGGVIQERLVPVFATVREKVSEFIPSLQGVWEIAKTVGSFIGDNMTPILAGLGVIVGGVVVASVWSLVLAVGALLSPFVLIVGAIALAVAGVVYAYKRFEVFRDVVDAVAQFLLRTVVPAVTTLAEKVVEQFGNAVAWVVRMWPQISEAIGHVMVAVREVVERVLLVVGAIWRTVGDDIFNVVSRVFHAIFGVIDGVLGAVRGLIQTVLAVINGDWGRAWAGLRQIVDGAWDAVFAVIAGALGVVRSLVGGLGGLISQATGNLAGILINAGKEVIEGLLDGIRSRLGAIAGVMRDVANKVKSGITSALGIASPSKVMAEYGRNIGQGLVVGIDGSSSGVAAAMAGLVDMPALPAINAAVGAGATGASAGTVVINVSGSVLSEHDLVDVVKRGLLADQRRSGSLGFV